MDDQQTRGRPVLKRIEQDDLELDPGAPINEMAQAGDLWVFCGEYDGPSEQRSVDAAVQQHGPGIYKVFPSGSWPGGYLRD